MRQVVLLLRRRATIVLLAVLLLPACQTRVAPSFVQTEQTPHNIILLIGDGMGIAHITAAKVENGGLNLDRFTTTGLITTHSSNRLITDSAAASTALATGHKTLNKKIAVDENGKPLKSVFEYAEEAGKSTGIAVSSTVTHATPAAFMSHINTRKQEAEIAGQIAASGIDVLFGGGRGYFLPGSVAGSRRHDESNLLEKMRKKMLVINSAEQLQRLSGDTRRVAGLFSSGAMPRAQNRSPSLAAMTAAAIRVLGQNNNGFFLMVEGSQIDWASHNNDQSWLISETIDFDEAVGKALDFAESDGNTLVIVTSDHETGGFALHGGSIKKGKIKSSFTREGHTGTMVALFAYGVGSRLFGGIHDNTFVGQKLIEYIQNK